MTGGTRARLLEELITDLASGMVPSAADGVRARAGRVRPVSVEIDLPIETRVSAAGDGDLVVWADVPPTRTRTPFDRPLGRLSIRLAMEGVR